MVLIRRISTSFANTTSILNNTAGGRLYTHYKRVLKKMPPEDEEIINDKDELKRAIYEILEASKF